MSPGENKSPHAATATATATTGLDPGLLEGLTEAQKQEALAAASAAKRAEERAERRALERAIERRRLERLGEASGGSNSSSNSNSNKNKNKNNGAAPAPNPKPHGGTAGTGPLAGRVRFVSKRQRAAQKEAGERPPKQSRNPGPPQPASSGSNRKNSNNNNNNNSGGGGVSWTDRDRRAVRDTYLGGSKAVNMTHEEFDEQRRLLKKKHQKKSKTGKKTNFRFKWDDTDDTLRADDPLYNGPSLGRGAVRPDRSGRSSGDRNARGGRSAIETKPRESMTSRDWRIFRENHNIVCKGGRAPPPLRSFRDGGVLHPSLVEVLYGPMGYRDPTPIQMQAIPIGLQRRDLIGIAETGSGKTAAFGIPLVQYLLQLPGALTSRERVAEFGPLAMVLAPTRELALQIDGEFRKLLQFSFGNGGSGRRDQRGSNHNSNHNSNPIVCCSIVGGQNMTAQAQRLRDGVHVVVGTPGRINDCLEMAYMVLNQCLYTVLDEGDQMINMGFAPQVESILDHMGGSLKSEDENEAYRQELADLERLKTLAGKASRASQELPKHRVTAMFTATMPQEVERMAKRYLRHPAVVSIGDRETRNNARIVQKIVFLSSPSQKEEALRRLVLDPRFLREKVIVFVNEKKHADGIGRAVERFGRRCVVLHGGKNQDEREHNLGLFRQGGIVLVATDVAGRGLDIPDVAHVINYDLPTRSIETYTHRVGRTGRAGKEGLATSLLTEEDQGIMGPLRTYLENTGSEVPQRLARHPAAQSGEASGGNLIY